MGEARRAALPLRAVLTHWRLHRLPRPPLSILHITLIQAVMFGCFPLRIAAVLAVCCAALALAPQGTAAAAGTHFGRRQIDRKPSHAGLQGREPAPPPPPPPAPPAQPDRVPHRSSPRRSLRQAAKAAMLSQAQWEKIGAAIRQFTVRLGLLLGDGRVGPRCTVCSPPERHATIQYRRSMMHGKPITPRCRWGTAGGALRASPWC